MNKQLITIYHYTELDKWMSHRPHGLDPRSLQSLHGEVSDPRSGIKAIFALLSPAPVEWSANQSFSTLWGEFIGTRGDLLLEIKADTDDKHILVGDAAYIEGYLYRGNQDLHIPTEYRIEDPDMAFRKYQDSLSQIGEYLRKGKQYYVPEVQIRRAISHDKVSISSQQPLLEAQLGDKPIRDAFKYPVPLIYKYQKELNDWIQDFESKKPWFRDTLAELQTAYEGRISGEG